MDDGGCVRFARAALHSGVGVLITNASQARMLHVRLGDHSDVIHFEPSDSDSIKRARNQRLFNIVVRQEGTFTLACKRPHIAASQVDDKFIRSSPRIEYKPGIKGRYDIPLHDSKVGRGDWCGRVDGGAVFRLQEFLIYTMGDLVFLDVEVFVSRVSFCHLSQLLS